jgi:hypothetical protein
MTLFRVPGPEEIYEAFQEGFIEYQDYRELLEISRAEFLSPADSVYLMQFPDLLAGFSSNPLFEADDVSPVVAIDKQGISPAWKQSLLYRQYHRLRHGNDQKQLYRIRGEYQHLSYYGESEYDYAGDHQGGRRYVQYDLASDSSTAYSIIIGNFRQQLGLGLIYGYHGRLFSKTYELDDMEQFLYPDYGGGNGLMIMAKRPSEQFTMLYDTDRRGYMARDLVALSVPFRLSPLSIHLSAVHGRLCNRQVDAELSVSLFSIYGESKSRVVQAKWELAVAESDRRYPRAAAVHVKWKRRKIWADANAWAYAVDYPSFFSGGPSSRRSHTLHIDRIDLSYSDRYSGEAGIILRTSTPATGGVTFRSAVEYARRAFDDDRMEARIGLKKNISDNYRMKFDCYWRSDHLYSDTRRQRRIQMEMIKYGAISRIRMVMGYRSERYNNRDDFLIMVEDKFSNRWGTLALLCKLDHLRPDDLQNRYLYLTGYIEAQMGKYLRSYIKYTYRYRRGQPESNYGTIRLDLNWTIQ